MFLLGDTAPLVGPCTVPHLRHACQGLQRLQLSRHAAALGLALSQRTLQAKQQASSIMTSK